MKITDVSYETITIPLSKPFSISYGTQTSYSGVLVKIETDEGLTGFGEAPASPHITGDTIKSIMGALDLFKPVLIDENPLNIPRLINKVDSAILHNYSAKKSVDNALYDIFSKYSRISIKDLLGSQKERMETSLTVSIGSKEDSLKEAEALMKMGAKVIKVKIGLCPKDDIERVKALSKAFDVPLRLDANGGYTLKEAVNVLKELEEYNIQFIEQPVKYHLLKDLKKLSRDCRIPIMADESVKTGRDLLDIIDDIDMVNIKLAKSGGIHEAVIMANILKKKDKRFMVGCMIETKLSIASSLHFSLGTGADFIDLDGFVDLKYQPNDDMVVLKDGYLSLGQP